eukprot:gene27616-33350_t
MVSVLDGQLSRTWFFTNKGRKHVINLYHDTITGVRSAMVDFVEIRGSTGNSSLFMEAKGHRIFFTVDDLPSFIEIKRDGWTGFKYTCVVNDKTIPESTQVIQDSHQDVFNEYPIVWYQVLVTRLADHVETIVHRRFRDFAEMNSAANFKGNHLLAALPPLPEKPLKMLTDHRDPAFIQDRQLKLESYLVNLIAIPHVPDMISVKAFLGIMDEVREYSLSFHTPQLGISLSPQTSANSLDTTVVVGEVVKEELKTPPPPTVSHTPSPTHQSSHTIQPGDVVSKVNGVCVGSVAMGDGLNVFEGLVHRIRALPRPLIIHFVRHTTHQVLPAPPRDGKGEDATDTDGKAQVEVEEAQVEVEEKEDPLPLPLPPHTKSLTPPPATKTPTPAASKPVFARLPPSPPTSPAHSSNNKKPSHSPITHAQDHNIAASPSTVQEDAAPAHTNNAAEAPAQDNNSSSGATSAVAVVDVWGDE